MLTENHNNELSTSYSSYLSLSKIKLMVLQKFFKRYMSYHVESRRKLRI